MNFLFMLNAIFGGVYVNTCYSFKTQQLIHIGVYTVHLAILGHEKELKDESRIVGHK